MPRGRIARLARHRSAALLLVLMLFTLFAQAADDAPKKSPFEGIWRWEFAMPDGSEVTPTLKLRTKDGKLTGTSRFRSGTETEIRNVKVKGDELSFDVKRDYLGDEIVTHYTGKLAGNDTIKGKITAKSSGGEHSYDWEAKRASGIDGIWKWSVMFGEREFESRVTLKREGEKLRGKITAFRGDRDIQHGRFRNNVVSFEVERRGRDGGGSSTNFYRGKFADDKITGTYTFSWEGDTRTNEWNAVRAD